MARLLRTCSTPTFTLPCVLQVALNPLTQTVDGRSISSAVNFFTGADLAFTPPFSRSSNTGYEQVDTEVVMLVQDPLGAVSLVLLHDAPCNTTTNTYCPITASGYSNTCSDACDQDGALTTFRVSLRRNCGLNGTACLADMTASNEFLNAYASDLTPYTAGGETVRTGTYNGANVCCPSTGIPTGVEAQLMRDWYCRHLLAESSYLICLSLYICVVRLTTRLGVSVRSPHTICPTPTSASASSRSGDRATSQRRLSETTTDSCSVRSEAISTAGV